MYGNRPTPFSPQRLTAKATRKPIHFICIAADAKTVFIAGNFNHWNPTTHPMQRQVDGSWHVSIELPHGGHHYQFIIDGKPMNDPKAHGLIRNDKGEKVSMIMVS
jgi:1,4-alpha-glucan branching enzyme